MAPDDPWGRRTLQTPVFSERCLKMKHCLSNKKGLQEERGWPDPHPGNWEGVLDPRGTTLSPVPKWVPTHVPPHMEAPRHIPTLLGMLPARSATRGGGGGGGHTHQWGERNTGLDNGASSAGQTQHVCLKSSTAHAPTQHQTHQHHPPRGDTLHPPRRTGGGAGGGIQKAAPSSQSDQCHPLPAAAGKSSRSPNPEGGGPLPRQAMLPTPGSEAGSLADGSVGAAKGSTEAAPPRPRPRSPARLDRLHRPLPAAGRGLEAGGSAPHSGSGSGRKRTGRRQPAPKGV